MSSTTSDIPRLMLVTPVLDPGGDISAPLKEALSTAGFAAVILQTGFGADERALLKTLKPLVELVQAADAAALLCGADDLAGKANADGVHVLGEKQAKQAAARFRPEKIAGAGGLRTRDAAMSAGEAGVDYVLFGDPGKGGVPPLESTVERLDWWAEIFNTPCAGQAERLEDVAALAATGAEFVALGSFVWTHEKGAGDAVARAAQLLAGEKVA